uniref:Branched-chain amino acid ABC transporter permease n=1 Tax=Ignisphaera aggregans TaxID=334771 RepID=A0A7C4BCX9_9CREN
MLVIVLTSLAYASTLAIGCAAITLLYTSTRVFNFAHASMVSWGFYLTYIFYRLTRFSPYLFMPLATLIVGLYGVAVYLLVIRRLIHAKASEITLMMVTLGVDFMLFAFLNILIDFFYYNFRWDIKTVNIVLRDPTLMSIADTDIKAIYVVAPVVALLLLLLMHMFLTKTNTGIAMRASIENPTLSSILGIDVDRVYILAWFIGGLFAGLSGGLLTMLMQGSSTIGSDIIVMYFAGSIVGGLQSILGGLFGGLLVGLSERLLSYSLSSIFPWIYSYRFVIPLSMLIATLVIYPRGLARLVERR